MEEGGFNYWNNLLRGPEAAADGSSSLPPPLSSDGWARINDQCPTHLDGSWALEDELEDHQSMMLGVGGDGIFFTAGTNGSLALDIDDPRLFGDQWILHGDECLPDQAGAADEESLDLDLDIDSLFDGTSSGVPPGVDSSGTSQASADSQLQASADQPWGTLPNASLEHTQVGANSPPAAPATDDGGTGGMMMTLADMIRIAEECGKDQAAGIVWSREEHQHLLHCLQLFAKHDGPNRCFHTSTSLHNKTALDVALRYRWLQDKEKPAKQAQLVQKDSAGKNSTGQGKGTKGAKKNSNMYPLSKEALDSKSTRELLQDSYIFMQQIEENIKSGKLGNDTADYFYYVKTNIDTIGKRENGFCRIGMPMPPIDEQGLEEILLQSRHSSSSAGKEAG
ncbi:unnamed protein product [Urochloa decumbens]|uniref:Uncharacterized protein n=1 Tax=Urochloa decumbens TaxID=240449 RepID=A0ABC8Y644_9POAL